MARAVAASSRASPPGEHEHDDRRHQPLIEEDRGDDRDRGEQVGPGGACDEVFDDLPDQRDAADHHDDDERREAWTADEPPSLFGVDFHQHAVLPLWVLHAWLWKDNPAGMFVDYNPKVRTCPEGVPIFGVDLP